MNILPPSPFLSSATAETLPSEFSGKSHCSDGSFSIDEDSLLERMEAIEIEMILKALFANNQ